MTKSGKVAMRKAISHSSFNTKTARQLRAKTPPAVTRTIVRKTSASKKSAR